LGQFSPPEPTVVPVPVVAADAVLTVVPPVAAAVAEAAAVAGCALAAECPAAGVAAVACDADAAGVSAEAPHSTQKGSSAGVGLPHAGQSRIAVFEPAAAIGLTLLVWSILRGMVAF
jgi:hypothetical protein